MNIAYTTVRTIQTTLRWQNPTKTWLIISDKTGYCNYSGKEEERDGPDLKRSDGD
jgi:hypothetical protein